MGRMMIETEPKHCVICGTAFERQAREGAVRFSKRRCCSNPCARKAVIKRPPRSCAVCGELFKPHTDRSKFCSLGCAAKNHKQPAPKGKPARYKKTNGVLEHRTVMESKLGRALVRGETVHHKNGVKNDNHPDNLELWFKPQPAGQRVPDLIAYVVQHHTEAVRYAQQQQLSCFFDAPDLLPEMTTPLEQSNDPQTAHRCPAQTQDRTAGGRGGNAAAIPANRREDAQRIRVPRD